MDETRGDGLTMEGARGVLAANEQLMNKFEEMVDCRSRVEDRTELSAAPESTTNMMISGDTAEQRTLQEYIVAQGQNCTRGAGRRNCSIRQQRLIGESRKIPRRERLSNVSGILSAAGLT